MGLPRVCGDAGGTGQSAVVSEQVGSGSGTTQAEVSLLLCLRERRKCGRACLWVCVKMSRQSSLIYFGQSLTTFDNSKRYFMLILIRCKTKK